MAHEKYILVVDLEATCWDDRPQSVDTMEVIEFGIAVATIDGTLHANQGFYVQPSLNPKLSSFCQALTGISQCQVDAAPQYASAVIDINAFLAEYDFSAWASWGQYDKHQIAAELDRYGITPEFFKLPHVNLKALWQHQKGSKRRAGLGAALASVGLDFVGNQHSGKQDAFNIVRLLPYIRTHDPCLRREVRLCGGYRD